MVDMTKKVIKAAIRRVIKLCDDSGGGGGGADGRVVVPQYWPHLPGTPSDSLPPPPHNSLRRQSNSEPRH